MTETKEAQLFEEFDHTVLIKSLLAIPFPIGKRLLIDFVRGVEDNSSIERNNLARSSFFGKLADVSEQELFDLLERLLEEGYITQERSSFNANIKVLIVTPKGQYELIKPSFAAQKEPEHTFDYEKTTISAEEKQLFEEFQDYLELYNREQKKAIISPTSHILCVAGAGSGKTTVLTKRIEFLVRYKSISPKKILAITFTRKAREEMQNRLGELGVAADVQTFNSFCEQFLRKYEQEHNIPRKRILGYGDKIVAIMQALDMIGKTIEEALDIYFTDRERLSKTPEQLQAIFVGDCFTLLDYLKNYEKDIPDFTENIERKHLGQAKLLQQVVIFLKEYVSIQGFRDYGDQIRETLEYFKKDGALIPLYEHVLVDEYQDVNAAQQELLDLLNPPHLFAVGDPRQSIFGWRGSDIAFIKNFEKHYDNTETIHLTTNYRSKEAIIGVMNKAIEPMSLPPLKGVGEEKGKTHLLSFDSEEAEAEMIAALVKESALPPKEIFVLARTNKQLQGLAALLAAKGIKVFVKADDERRRAASDEVTVATVHAIKGLEAELVIVAGCNDLYFPCKAAEHPVLDVVKMQTYDKIEEERRLFYVAISRAKSQLILTYTGKRPTMFVTAEMESMLQGQQ